MVSAGEGSRAAERPLRVVAELMGRHPPTSDLVGCSVEIIFSQTERKAEVTEGKWVGTTGARESGTRSMAYEPLRVSETA